MNHRFRMTSGGTLLTRPFISSALSNASGEFWRKQGGERDGQSGGDRQRVDVLKRALIC
jgi:hypothetical protein